jgi:hypothetical protein
VTRPIIAVAVLVLGGCATVAPPARPGLLEWRRTDAMELTSQGAPVASAPTFEGLADFVRCVPDAARHARAAESAGGAGHVLSTLAVTGALVGLGGLYGLSDRARLDGTQWAFLGSGLVIELVSLGLAGGSLQQRTQALGHALDAANYYNDAVDAGAASCP